MLLIRTTQIQALAQLPRRQFIAEMMEHLYRYFPTQAWLLTRDELRSHVEHLLDRAASYRLTSRQQVCRFINLAATYGWTFDSDPDLLWMHDILTDGALVEPGERLNRLVESCLHRQRIEARNLAQRRALGLVPADVPTVLQPQGAADHSGPWPFEMVRPEPISTQTELKPNPADHRLSDALYGAEETFVDD